MKFRLKYLVLLLFVIGGVACTDDVPVSNDSIFHIDGNTVVFNGVDRESMLRNPCTGWGLYDDAQDYVGDHFAYWYEIEEYAKYATHFYIRWRWAELEPEEGKYVWLDENSNFSLLVKKAKELGLKLAFRIYYDSAGNHRQATPDYVRQAGAKGRTEQMLWSPYIDDPVFHAKLENFVHAFAQKFDDPDVVDFVDGFNLGYWGEGHDFSFSPGNDNPQTLSETVKWITNLYGNAFKHVQLVINYHKDIGQENLDWVVENQDYQLRHDAFGSQWYGKFERDFAAKYATTRMIVAESCYWFVGTDKGAYMSGGVDFTEQWRNDITYSPSAKTWDQVHRRTVSEALEARANTLDLREVREAKSWTTESMDQVKEFIAKGGYRFTPVAISFPEVVQKGSTVKLGHSWRNAGYGICPNHSRRWNNKYKVAFSLIDQNGAIAWSAVDENANPGDWLRGQDYNYILQVSLPKDLEPGTYDLAIAICDTSKEGVIPSIELAVQNQVLIDKWTHIHELTVK